MIEHDQAANPQTDPHRLRSLAQRGSELAAIVAANPAAPGWLLRDLSRSRSHAVRRAVAGNANTPPEQLALLAKPHPDALLANPMLPLLILTQPNFLIKAGRGGVRALVTHPDCPRDLLTFVAQHRLLDQLLVRDEARLHITLRGDLGATWKEAMIEEVWALPAWRKLLRHLIPCQETPLPLQERLAAHPDRYFRARFAANAAIDEALQLQLAADQEPVVRRYLARNQALAPATIEALAHDSDPETRRTIARSKRAPRWSQRREMDWEVLLEGRLLNVRPVVAAFSTAALWESLLAATEQLYRPRDPMTLAASDNLVRNVRCRVIYPNSEYTYPIVVSWIERLLLAARHPATSAEQLRMLAGDSNAIVRAAARERLATLGRL